MGSGCADSISNYILPDNVTWHDRFQNGKHSNDRQEDHNNIIRPEIEAYPVRRMQLWGNNSWYYHTTLLACTTYGRSFP